MRRETLVDESEAFMTTSRTIGVALFSVFLIGISLGAAMTQDGLGLFSSSPEPFNASVDNGMGTNQYIMVEVDEGDNDEEILVGEVDDLRIHAKVRAPLNRGARVEEHRIPRGLQHQSRHA